MQTHFRKVKVYIQSRKNLVVKVVKHCGRRLLFCENGLLNTAVTAGRVAGFVCAYTDSQA